MEDRMISKLNCCSWEILSSDSGSNNWLVKFVFENGSYHLALTDMSVVYTESLQTKEIAERCSELNKRLEAPLDSILNHLKESVLHHHQFNYTSEAGDGSVILSLSNKVRSVPFNWKFNCEICKDVPLTGLLFCNPIVLSISRLILENNKLKGIIKQKDDEIQDYKENGSKVSRPHLETELFDAIAFEKDLKSSKDYAYAITKEPLKIAAGKAFNDLVMSSSEDNGNDEISKQLTQTSQRKTKQTTSCKVSTPKKSLAKRRRVQARPSVRGCILEISDDEESQNVSFSTNNTAAVSIAEAKNIPDYVVTPKKHKVSKKQRKPLF